MALVPPRRAEIDTRAPFRSVKEAVSLFGERVLAGEVYAGKLNKQMHKDTSIQHEKGSSKIGYMTAELEETKHSLLKAKQETTVMANCLSSLQEELERTRRELQELKLERESEKQMMEYEIEDLKFIEDPPNPEIIPSRRSESKEVNDDLLEFQKKRYVTFANAHLSQVVEPERRSSPLLERHPSLRKKKKQPLIPLIGGIFSRKKKSSGVAYAHSP